MRARRESGLEMLKAARDASRRSSERRAAMRAEALGSHAMPAVSGDGMWRGETWGARWRRRAITVPGIYLATLLYTALLPLALVCALASDLLRRRPLMLCRFHLTMWSVFFWHSLGVASVAVWWLWGKATGMDERRWRTWHAGLETWWSHKLIGIARLFYGLRVEVEDGDAVRPGPALLLLRHASIVDTMLPMGYLGGPARGVLMRIVKKRELLWDPCVDFISSRVPRAFVVRRSGNVERELEVMCALTDGMDDDDLVALFPEGTRYTAEKQIEIMEKLRVRDPAAAERHAGLRHVLPIRPAGTMALLDRRADLDVVFCAHTGLEGASRLEDFLNGSLLGRVWRIKLWRVPRREVPADPAARLAWLEAEWRKVDDWIDHNRQYGDPRRRWLARRYGRRRAAA
ncbi:MAG TPA: 1-acyl-sn-glycerol-3-phosphate acyltransferase [Kofleriaceae bacterium]|nr:1-acyl-sn-glycerol-3-phosphate acyltransferase [Kofleriaceae bacterium]